MKARELARLARPTPGATTGVAAWTGVADAQRAARRCLPRPVMDFIEGGAEDEATLSSNERARDDWTLVPRVLRAVVEPDLRRTIVGEGHTVPFVLAPTGFTGVVRPHGELLVARAAHAQGVAYTVSAAASNTDLDELVAATPQGLWFNYYPLADAARGHELLDRAWGLGFRTVVVTVDVPVAGWRERDIRSGFSIPPRLTATSALHGVRHPGWTSRFLRAQALGTPNLGHTDVLASSSAFPTLFAKDVGWTDIAAIRSRWPGSVVVKGILSVADAALAAEHGLDGIVVSNHGGRQLDGAPAALRMLEPMAQELRPLGLDVLVDSGFRRGRDIVTAIALGATAVMIGRPYLYGLAADGQAGVERVITILRDEVRRCLHLLGVSSLESVDRAVLASTHQGPR